MTIRRLVGPRAGLGAAVLLAFTASAADNPARAWSLEEAAAPYRGEEVHHICDGYSPCMANQELAKEFEQLTGIKVIFEIADLNAVQEKILADALTQGEYYDLVQAVDPALGLWVEHGFAMPLDKFMDDPKLRDPGLSTDDFVPEIYQYSSVYEGRQYAFPYHFLPPFAIYRKDIAADPGERAAFKEKYGYEMPLSGELISESPTWDEWNDIAAFFTRKAGENAGGTKLDHDLYGTVAAFKRHLTVFYDFERILVGMGGEYVDKDGNAAVDNDTGRKALAYMLNWRQWSPPSYPELTWDEEYSEFCNGNLFSTFSWGDTTPYIEDPAGCPAVAGKLGYFLHGERTPAEGLNMIIPTTAKHPEAAFLFAQWIATKEVQLKCQKLGCATYRKDVLFDPSLDDDPRFLIHRKAVERGLYTPPHPPGMLAVQDIAQEELSAAGAGQQDVETTIARMQQRFTEALAP